MNKGVAYMGLSISFFAVQNVAMKYLEHLPALELVAGRGIVALALAYSALRLRGIPSWGNNRRRLALRGLLGFFALSLFVMTVQELPLATALVIQYMSPIFVAVLGVVVLKERMRPVQWLFLAVCMAGVVMIKGFDPNVKTLFLVLGLISSIFSAMAYTTVRTLKDTDDPLVVTFYFPLMTLPLSSSLIGVNALLPSDMQSAPMGFQLPVGWEWAWLLIMGIFAQLGQYFMTKAFHVERASVVGSMSYLGIIYGIIFGYFLFGESYTFAAALGIAMVLAGVVGNVVWGKR